MLGRVSKNEPRKHTEACSKRLEHLPPPHFARCLLRPRGPFPAACAAESAQLPCGLQVSFFTCHRSSLGGMVDIGLLEASRKSSERSRLKPTKNPSCSLGHVKKGTSTPETVRVPSSFPLTRQQSSTHWTSHRLLGAQARRLRRLGAGAGAGSSLSSWISTE